MKKIFLTQGKSALVDDGDYEKLKRFKWHAQHQRCGNWYAARNINRNGKHEIQYMHNAISKSRADTQTDHADGDGLHNWRNNLREITRGQNQHNQKVRTGKKSSRFKGVYWHKPSERWVSQITIDGKTQALGYFKDEVDAANAYDDAAMEHFGEFARLNFESLSVKIKVE
jgi:hypothetical protein